MYADGAMGGPQRTTISPEEIFLETQFSLASGHDQMPISGFDMPNYPRRFWNDEHVLDLQIRHRTRSHKGWTSIASDDKIRVTKDRGKVFQVVLDSPLPFPKESVVLNLELNGQIVDAATGGLKVVRVSGVSTRVDNMQTKYSVEVSIKISALCDHLRVVASVATDTNHILTGKTVEFMTHNNGKVPLNQREESPEPKKVQFVVPSQSPPQCAMRQQQQQQPQQQPQPQQRSSPQQPLPSQHMPYPQQQQPQQQGLILGGEPQGFRGDQRQAIHSQYTNTKSSSLKGSGSGGKKGDIQNTNNMSLLYNKLVENSQPESPPHPVVGDCSSPESGVDDEPPLSQMKKRKYNPTPPRLHSPPHQTPSGVPPTAYHMHPPHQHQHQQYFAPMQPPQLYHHPHQQQQQPPPLQHAQQAPPQPRSRKQAGHYSDSSYSSDSSSRNSGSLGAEGWGAAFGSSSPQSTPEEEFEMQEMAHGAEIASGQGSEEEEYGSCGSQTPLAPAPKNTAAQVINGDLSVRGAVRARAYMQYSDIRLKTDVEGIVDAIDLISKLDGKKYRWKPNAFERKGQDPSLSDDEDESDAMTSDSEDSDDIETGSQIGLLDAKATVWNFGFSSKEELEEPHEKKGQKVIGLIAQEVQRVLPEVVTEDEDGYLSVAYAEIVPVLISAFNEHMANYNAEQTVLMKRFDEFERQLEDMTDEKEAIDDKETLAQLAQEMKELIPESEYSRLVKKLSRIRRRDRIIQRNCCCLLILMFCFVIGLSVALALIAPVTYSNIYTVVYPDSNNNNNNNNDGNTYPDPFAAAAARVYQFVSVTSNYAFFSGTRVDTSTLDTLTVIASYNAKPPNDPFSLLISHSVSVPSNRRRDANPKDGDLLSLRTDDEDPALNFSASLVSLFEYVEANGQSGFQSGESSTTLVAAPKSSWIPLSSRTFTAHNDNGPVTVLCASSIGNSMLFVEACIAEQTVIYEGAVYSPDFVHMQVRVNRTLTERNYNYAVILNLGSKAKSDVTYDVVTPSLIYSEEDNNAVVGQMTWQTSVAGNTTIIPSWKKAQNQMTYSFAGSEIVFPESWYFNVGIRYLSS